MKWLNIKIEKFVNWLKLSGYGVQMKWMKEPIVVPSEMYWNEYTIENPNVEPLNEQEKKYLKVKSQNIIFDLVMKGYVPQIAVKTLLAYYCSMDGKVDKTANKKEEKPTMIFDFGAISNAKKFETPDDISFENEAIEAVLKENKNV